MKVLIAVLCGRERDHWIAPHLAMRLIEATHERDDVGVQLVYGVYGYHAARNRAVEQFFLGNQFDILCMVDNDSIPPRGFVSRVLEFEASQPDADIIALPAYIFPHEQQAKSVLNVGWHVTADMFDCPFQLPERWQQVDVAGAACICIRRAVLETLKKPWFRIPERAFAQNLINGGCEDFDFSDCARAAGFHIWTHGGLLVDHVHSVSLNAIAKATVARNDEDLAIIKRLELPLPVSEKVRV